MSKQTIGGIEVIVDDENIKHLPSIKNAIHTNAQTPQEKWICWDCGESFSCSQKPKQIVNTVDRKGAFCGCGVNV